MADREQREGINICEAYKLVTTDYVTDASFANNKDYSSQVGYVIVLADENDNCNIIHWSSIKCKRVTRSVIASELYAMTHGFDTTCALKDTLDKIAQRQTSIVICIDSLSLYEC